MFVGHQKIPHRRVVNSFSNPGLSNPQYSQNNSSLYKKHPQIIQRDYFGVQRKQLADFVMKELNQNHKNDADVLQRFRRQAEQSKQRKFRLKRAETHITPIKPPQFRPQINFLPFKSQIANQYINQNKFLSPIINPNFSSNLAESRQIFIQPKVNASTVQQMQPQVIIIKDSQSNRVNNDKEEYLMMQNKDLKQKLKKKNQALKLAKKKVYKCQKYINQMRDQKHYDNQQRTANHINKIQSMINEISQKIQNNAHTLNDSLLQIQQVHKKNSVYNSAIVSRKKIYDQKSERKQKHLPSMIDSRLPSVYYSDANFPRQNKIKRVLQRNHLPHSNSFHKNSYGREDINKIYDELQKLKESRQRMDAYNFFEDQIY